MHTSRKVEIWVGAFAAMGLGALLGMALWVSNLNDFQDPTGYTLTADFDNVGGLKPKAQVAMAGVTVGRVTSVELDEETFQARVTMTIKPRYDKLPADTIAGIRTSGLLGEQFVGLTPGGSLESLKDGSHIEQTQSALVLEDLIGQFMYRQAAGNQE